MHQLSDEDLKGLIIEETGAGDDSAVPNLILNCINSLKAFANFETPAVTTVIENQEPPQPNPPGNSSLPPPQSSGLGMNLSYTINLNLPATSDIAVFNAIFKSLKENLLSSGNE